MKRNLDAARIFRLAICTAILAVPLAFAGVSLLSAQGAQTPPVPDWQTAAGGKMEFDVASVKEDTSGAPPQTLFPLGPGNMYTPTGGRFSTSGYPLFFYIAFAYKMNTTQMSSLQHTLPSWVTSKRYDIEAHAPGNPGKDQMRLMVQSLLASRFKLAIRMEAQQKPIFALVLDKPGKTGPHLQPYPDGTPCDASTPTGSNSTTGPLQTVGGLYPVICGGYAGMPPSAPGLLHVGARNVTIQIIADQFPGLANDIDRPVYDHTGLTGTYDFSLEFQLPQLPGANAPAGDVAGPSFLEALKDQLGLRLDSQTGPVNLYVIDHIEEPSPN
jgi:bla regulator protein blaR1